MPALTRDRRFWGSVAVLICLAALPQFVGNYIVFVVGLTLVYAVSAIGLTILTGRAGQIGLAHAGFYALGAYGSAILMSKLGWTFLPSLAVTAVAVRAIGFLIGFPALRLSGFYLAIATLGFATLIGRALIQWSSFTGGAAGMSVRSATILGMKLGPGGAYYLTLVVMAVLTVVAINILRSRIGRAFIALRDSEVAASSIGINVAFYKMLAFAISAFYAGIGGALHGQLLGFINPDQFNIWLMVTFLAMIVVGGLGSIPGALIGAAFFTLTPELLQELQYWQRLAFGVIIMLTIAFLPGGIVSIPSHLRRVRTPVAPPPSAEVEDQPQPSRGQAVSRT